MTRTDAHFCDWKTWRRDVRRRHFWDYGKIVVLTRGWWLGNLDDFSDDEQSAVIEMSYDENRKTLSRNFIKIWESSTFRFCQFYKKTHSRTHSSCMDLAFCQFCLSFPPFSSKCQSWIFCLWIFLDLASFVFGSWIFCPLFLYLPIEKVGKFISY